MQISHDILNQRQAAQYLGTTVGTLNSWRHCGKNTLPFIRWGNRIRYRKSDLDAWIERQLINKLDEGGRKCIMYNKSRTWVHIRYPKYAR